MRQQTRDFLRTFNLSHPIIQAPMAGASTIEMAAVVTNKGGIGSLPQGSLSESPDVIRKQFEEFNSLISDKSRTKTVNLNFFSHDPPIGDSNKERKWLEKYKKIYESDGLKWTDKASLKTLYPSFASISDINHPTITALTRLSPKIVSFHFGIPNLSILKHLQSHEISIFITVTSVSEFNQAVEAGVDGVVLQGWEAGGHRGNFKANDEEDQELSTRDLVDSVIKDINSRQLESPPWLIATGGIVDSKEIQEFLDLGVAGVQLGTVFLPSSTSTISSSHRECFTDPFNRKTIMNPAISGRNLRTVETPFLKDLMADVDVDEIPMYPLPYDVFKQLGSDAKGSDVDGDFNSFLAGSGFYKAWKGTDNIDDILDGLLKDLKY